MEGTTNSEEQEEYYQVYEFTTDPGQSKIRIDKFLMDKIDKITRNKLQNTIKSGGVTVDGNPVKPNYRVRPSEKIKAVISKPPESMGHLKGEPMDINIVYEDDDLMVINKPPNLVVHPGVGNHSGTLVNGLVHYFEKTVLPNKDDKFMDRPGLVHRIDKDTSGLLLIAKTEHAMSHLGQQFFDHSIERTYQALVWSEPEEHQGTIDLPLARNPHNRLQMAVVEDGKHAITHYKVLLPMYYVSLVECKLETGRTHQIRAHMKHIRCPLFADERYGGDKIIKGTVYTKYKQFVMNTFKEMPRQALHAKTLGFIHPTTGEKMFFDSELPDDFKNCVERWKKYLSFRKDVLQNEQ